MSSCLYDKHFTEEAVSPTLVLDFLGRLDGPQNCVPVSTPESGDYGCVANLKPGWFLAGRSSVDARLGESFFRVAVNLIQLRDLEMFSY